MNHADRIIDFHFNLEQKIHNVRLPKNVEWLIPYAMEETKTVMNQFYHQFYADNNSRTLLFGINPGRFGAGITGIPFTDPKKLLEIFKIKTTFHLKSELSADFIYGLIHAYGGIKKFYSEFYISSLCPLGFIKEGINFNYYDDLKLQKAVTPFIIQNIIEQKKLVLAQDTRAYCLGEGKNFAFFQKINEKYTFFKQIIPLPHPRWIMQYRRKRTHEFIEYYMDKLSR